jgi:hypothetical protein
MIAVLRSAAPFAGAEVDHHRPQRAPSTSMDCGHGTRAGRGESNAFRLAVLEQELAAFDLVADLDKHARLHERVITCNDGYPRHLGSCLDTLLRCSPDRKVETLFDDVFSH